MLKSLNLKKIMLGIVVVLIIYFAYEYQKPIMTTREATKNAVSCLNNPPKEIGIKLFKLKLSEISLVRISIDTKKGFFYNLTNKRELSVTLKTKNGEQTVSLDAYNGTKCIEVSGPLN